jgi:hypothetical protein
MADDYSSTVTQMRTVTSPGTVGSESQATSLAGEIERLRYALEDLKGSGSRWYGAGPVYNVRSPRWGAVADGATDDTTAIQNAIDACNDAGGGTVWLPEGDYAVDTLHLSSKVNLVGDGMGATILSMIPHATTHHPVILIGDSGSPGGGSPVGVGNGKVTFASVRHLSIDGNKAQQTGVGDQFSPGIMVWGSDNNFVEYCEIYDCQGDGVWMGYGVDRVHGANQNVVQHCVFYGNARQQIALTFGAENVFAYNVCSGAIDLENDAGPTGEIRKNIVHGNTGRVGGTTTLSNTSDLIISLASLSTDKTSYFGNIVSNNVAFKIVGGYNQETVITGNTIIGSDASQAYLMELDAFDGAIVSNNTFVANEATASSLTAILRTRAGSFMLITDNMVLNETVPFHEYISTLGAEPGSVGHIYTNNLITGTGRYHLAFTERPSEEAVLMVQTDGGATQTLTVNQISGVPLFTGAQSGNSPLACGPLTLTTSGTMLIFTLAGTANWTIELLPHCETGAQAEPWNEHAIMSIDEDGTNRTVTVFTAPVAAGALTYVAYSFAGSGTEGTLFFRITY